jgi:hypothetical protein
MQAKVLQILAIAMLAAQNDLASNCKGLSGLRRNLPLLPPYLAWLAGKAQRNRQLMKEVFLPMQA